MPIIWRGGQKLNSTQGFGPVCAKRDSEFWRAHAPRVLVSVSAETIFHLELWIAVRDALAKEKSATARTRSLPRVREYAKLFAESLAELGARVFAVELGNETGADLGRTHCFALESVGAVAEFFCVHRVHHFQHTSLALRRTLR
jgi:hypothetical protein